MELEGDLPLWWDQQEAVLGMVEEFLVGARRSLEPTRVLATVLSRPPGTGSWPPSTAPAGAGEIVVSRTVRDLVAGSDVVMEDRGSQPLRGLVGEWELFGVVSR